MVRKAERPSFSSIPWWSNVSSSVFAITTASTRFWKAVVEHPLSGVTDKNKNGIGDHLE